MDILLHVRLPVCLSVSLSVHAMSIHHHWDYKFCTHLSQNAKQGALSTSIGPTHQHIHSRFHLKVWHNTKTATASHTHTPHTQTHTHCILFVALSLPSCPDTPKLSLSTVNRGVVVVAFASEQLKEREMALAVVELYCYALTPLSLHSYLVLRHQ